MRARLVLPLFIAGVLAALALVLTACGDDSSSGGDKRQALAVSKAKAAFTKAEKAGVDLSAGPCIAEQLPGLADWAADVAHDPRQAVDDEPANQCQSYREGRTHHFVELTPQGQPIRAQ
jgi:hypothetical protein